MEFHVIHYCKKVSDVLYNDIKTCLEMKCRVTWLFLNKQPTISSLLVNFYNIEYICKERMKEGRLLTTNALKNILTVYFFMCDIKSACCYTLVSPHWEIPHQLFIPDCSCSVLLTISSTRLLLTDLLGTRGLSSHHCISGTCSSGTASSFLLTLQQQLHWSLAF